MLNNSSQKCFESGAWRGWFLELLCATKNGFNISIIRALETYLQACVRDNGSGTRLQYRHPKLWASEHQNAQSRLNWVVVCEHFKNRNTNRLECILLIDVGCYKAECNLEISILSLRRHYKSFSFLISEETELPQEFGRVFRIFEPASWSLTNGHHREKTYKTALTRSVFLPRDTDGPF